MPSISQINSITIKQWNKEQFLTNKKEWNNLLQTSDADNLFLSWEWQYTWWNTFSEIHKLKLMLLVAFNTNGDLVGIAPLYVIHSKTKKIINTTQLQFIGNICRGKATMRTEYIDFIVDKKNSLPIKRSFLEYINKKIHWDEFYFTDLKKCSSTYSLIRKRNILTNVYVRTTEEYKSYYINTTQQFQQYITERGKNTRLRTYNRRKRLETKGDLELITINADKIDYAFSLLQKLHKKRWGKEAFKDERLMFNVKLAKLMAKRSALKFSILSINNTAVSIQYNYVVNQHEYNIQAGFDENFDKKLALGYLHFGYAIEAAFNNETLIYDFLAGTGKKTDYKGHLTNTYSNIVQFQIIKKKSLQFLYYTKDFIKIRKPSPYP